MIVPVLEDERAKLEPLTLENYTLLLGIAAEEGLVQYSPSEIHTPEKLKSYVDAALKQHSKGTAVPFIIFDKCSGSYAGCTRFMNIDHSNKVLDIGATWIGRGFQGSGLNTHVKRLMIDYAFSTLDFEKIEFRVDERNLQSRKAVEKLGAKLEGILRKNVYLPSGFKRNTCCYGILREEWKP